MDRISYLAGILDGEGYFYISRAKGRYKRPFVFQPYVGCTMKNKEPISLLEQEYGGSISIFKSRNEKHNDCWSWSSSSNSIKQIYYDMVNILLVKKEQLILLNEFLILRDKIGNQPITNEAYDQSNEFWERMKILNKRGKNG